MRELEIPSSGLNTAIDVTDDVAAALGELDAAPGLVGVYAHGSSLGLVLMRFEPGTVQDLLAALEKVAPLTTRYAHELTTGDPNGAAHIRSRETCSRTPKTVIAEP
ncbi:YjbQ family protein [Agromyces intestinalis]|nr:YjbQ family protein [Agromyces intestinalis]